MEIDLQLFSGGGAKFNQRSGGGGRDRDAVNENEQRFRFIYIDEKGQQKFRDINAENYEEARKYFMEIKDALKAKKLVKVGRSNGGLTDNVISSAKSLTDPKSSNQIDLNNSPLAYTKSPSEVSSGQLSTVKDKAKQIRDKSNEHLVAFDKDGKVVGESEGGLNSVGTTKKMREQTVSDLHNHSRGEGIIGGTFSVKESEKKGDILDFVNNKNLKTSFASTKEGLYYISKKESFKGKQFLSHMQSFEDKTMTKMNSDLQSLKERSLSGKISHERYMTQYRQTMNKALVDMHNEYLKNQKKYGYSYGLIKD